VEIGSSAAELLRHIFFSRWRLSAILDLKYDNGEQPTKCRCWSEICPKIWSWSA